jgi:hypothetical protein
MYADINGLRMFYEIRGCVSSSDLAHLSSRNLAPGE